MSKQKNFLNLNQTLDKKNMSKTETRYKDNN